MLDSPCASIPRTAAQKLVQGRHAELSQRGLFVAFSFADFFRPCSTRVALWVPLWVPLLVLLNLLRGCRVVSAPLLPDKFCRKFASENPSRVTRALPRSSAMHGVAQSRPCDTGTSDLPESSLRNRIRGRVVGQRLARGPGGARSRTSR